MRDHGGEVLVAFHMRIVAVDSLEAAVRALEKGNEILMANNCTLS